MAGTTLAFLTPFTSVQASSFTAYQVPSGQAGNQDFGGILGMDFDVNNSIKVSELGAFDDLGNGIVGTLTTELWSRSGDTGIAKLATLTFSNSDPGSLEGGSRFKTLLSPLVLDPGSYTIVSYGYSGNDLNGNSYDPTPWTTNDGGGLISFVGSSRYGGTLGSSIGDTVDILPANRYATGTFKYQAVPEPEPLAMLGAGTAIALGANFKRKLAKNSKKK
ncbi:PEP-CTERM sorting domain-containing protein [Aphanothece sacrum]|nr:PEP-CTERM sorting domain-containing protein [Aphanothece sacrum]